MPTLFHPMRFGSVDSANRIGNPNLVSRLTADAPLAPVNGATPYGGDATGNTDYPFLHTATA